MSYTYDTYLFFTAVLRVAAKRFLADATITGNMRQLPQKNEESEKKGPARTGTVDGRGGRGGEGAHIVGYAVR